MFGKIAVISRRLFCVGEDGVLRRCIPTARRAAGFSATRSTARRPNSSAFPYADMSLYSIPEGAEEALVMLSDIFPTGFECGVLNGKVAPGSARR